MAKANSTLTWQEIDPQTLPESVGKAYQEYKAQYRAMKEARGVFEDSLQAGAPEGMRIVCGYNFGKLSMALAPDDRKPAKAKAQGSLEAFMAAAQASGRRA